MSASKKILVTGATGFLGSQVVQMLRAKRDVEVVSTSLSLGLDLRNENHTIEFFMSCKPVYVINCAAFVGGISWGYKYPADIFHNNSLMTGSLLEACRLSGAKRLINPISNCAYPAELSLFKEEDFWDGPLHETVLAYGLTRKALVVGTWAYSQQYGLDSINMVLSNMFGPGDHFDVERSHALGALIAKFVRAVDSGEQRVDVWGTGKPVREWLYVEDGAEALIRGLDCPSSQDIVNIGVGKGITIRDLAETIASELNFKGELFFDTSKPDGAPFKTVDGAKGKALLNWTPTTDLRQAIRKTIAWYVEKRG
jgi:GDP-L-fucose synthase